MMSLDIFAYLKRSDLCKGFSDQELIELKSYMEILNLPKGHVLFSKGDLADALYIIAGGSVDVRIEKDYTIASLSENAVLGEVGILTDCMRSATVVTTAAAIFLKINRGILERLLAEERLVAYKLVYQIAKILSFRLRRMDQAMISLKDDLKRPHELEQLRARLQADWPF